MFKHFVALIGKIRSRKYLNYSAFLANKKIELNKANKPDLFVIEGSSDAPKDSMQFNRVFKISEETRSDIDNMFLKYSIKESVLLPAKTKNKLEAYLVDKYDVKIGTPQNYKQLFDKVSIVIVSFNNTDYLKACIESIINKTSYPAYEVVIVDNGSKQDTVSYIKDVAAKYTDIIKPVFSDKNLGFAKANNLGIKNASGKYIVLLNNDVLVTRGWLWGLLRHLKDPSVGIVGPVTNSIGNEARINVNYKDISQMDSFADEYARHHYGKSFEINTLAMFCIAFKKSLIDKIGLIDEQFGLGFFEDDDFSHRIQAAGYKTICAEDVFVHHFGSISFKMLKSGEYKELMESNLRKFENKWKIKWSGHRYRKGVYGEPKRYNLSF